MRPPTATCGPRTWAAEAVATGLMMLGGLSGVALCFELFASQSVRLLFIGMLFGGCVSLITHTSVSLPAAAGLEIGMTALLMGTILAAGRWAPLAVWPVIGAVAVARVTRVRAPRLPLRSPLIEKE